MHLVREHAFKRRIRGKDAQVLTQCGDVGLLSQRGCHGAADVFKGLQYAMIALKNVDHVQTEASVYEAWQDTYGGMTKNFTREFGRAIACGQPAEITASGTTWTVRQ